MTFHHDASRRSHLGVAGAAVLAAVLFAAMTGCSDSTTRGAGSTAAPTTRSIKHAAPRPDGPAATITGPMTGGKGVNIAAATPAGPALDAAGYDEAEFVASGTATSYSSAGALPADGTFALTPAKSAEYRTRILVRRPRDRSRFNGTVAVEWINVSGGIDAGVDYTYLQDELLRQGYIWVGVSAQRIGIEGGPIAVKAPGAEEAGAGKGLRGIDPARYGGLSHPGDAFAFDIYTQVARSLLTPGSIDPLAGATVEQLLAVGESQSAFALTTYYNGVQPLTKAFDGFLVHSRGGGPMSIDPPNGYADVASSIGGTPTRLRTDQAAPAIVVQTESDVLSVLGFYPARQPDADHLRIWEVAGTAHADKFQIGDHASSLGCPTEINTGQQVFVLRSALRHLREWTAGGDAPPHGDPLEVTDGSGTPKFVLDDVGNVRGGVRTPSVDAATNVLSGLAQPGSSVICLLSGSTTPLPTAQLARLYPTRAAYLERYAAATADAIRAGFILEEDRANVQADAHPEMIAS